MTDPRRLLDDAPSDLARALLVAAREEAPSEAAIERTLTAVGAGAAVLGSGAVASATSAKAGIVAASTAKAGAATGTAGLFLKWAGVGLATGLATATIAENVRAPEEAKPPAIVLVSAKEVETSAAPLKEPEPALPLEAPAAIREEEAPSAPSEETPALRTTSIAAAASPPVAKSSTAPSLLAEEVVALDEARAELTLGRPSRALAVLDAYEHRIPSGTLTPEALYLRAEALFSAGELDRAAAVARRLLAVQPHGPHARRARAIAEASNP